MHQAHPWPPDIITKAIKHFTRYGLLWIFEHNRLNFTKRTGACYPHERHFIVFSAMCRIIAAQINVHWSWRILLLSKTDNSGTMLSTGEFREIDFLNKRKYKNSPLHDYKVSICSQIMENTVMVICPSRRIHLFHE